MALPPLPPEADALQQCAARFSACPLLGLRKQILLSFAGAMLLVIFPGVLLSLPLLAGGGLSMALLAAAGYLLISGWRDNTYLFQKCRDLVLGAGRKDWLTALGAGLLVLLVLWVFGLLWICAVLLFVACGAAVGLHQFVDRRIAAWRAEPIRQAREIANRLREAGQEEPAIHAAVARAGGEHWEEFFESLFGYEAMIAARTTWGRGDDGRDRRRFRPWRDPILRWIQDRLRARREANEQRVLEAELEKQLLTEGKSAPIARQRARNRARFMIEHPSQVHETYAEQPADVADKRETQYRALQATMEKADDEIEEEPNGWAKLRDAAAIPIAVVFGQRARFLLGCALVAGCLLWAHQNGLFRQPSEDEWNQTLGNLDEVRTAIQQSNADAALAKSEQLAVERSGRYKPLELPPLPAALTAVFDSFNPGVAGLVLILAGFVYGLKISLYVFPAAGVMLLAHTTGIAGLVPPLGNSLTSLAIGLAVALAGFLFGRSNA
jgi:hypothetical protein